MEKVRDSSKKQVARGVGKGEGRIDYESPAKFSLREIQAGRLSYSVTVKEVSLPLVVTNVALFQDLSQPLVHL